jgi:hypothetical protein
MDRQTFLTERVYKIPELYSLFSISSIICHSSLMQGHLQRNMISLSCLLSLFPRYVCCILLSLSLPLSLTKHLHSEVLSYPSSLASQFRKANAKDRISNPSCMYAIPNRKLLAPIRFFAAEWTARKTEKWPPTLIAQARYPPTPQHRTIQAKPYHPYLIISSERALQLNPACCSSITCVMS